MSQYLSILGYTRKHKILFPVVSEKWYGIALSCLHQGSARDITTKPAACFLTTFCLTKSLFLQQEIEAALEKVCSLLPSTIRQECDAFVEEYTTMIVKLLVQQVDPKQVCTLIGLCSSKMTEMSYSKSY